MVIYTKKKMLQIIEDLLDGTKALQAEKNDGLQPVWVENLGFFQLLIDMLGGHLRSFGEEYNTLLEIIQIYTDTVEELKISCDATKSERDAICKKMKKNLEQLQFELKKQIPQDKKELLFLPYNYAMWDSLESIWKAAVESGEFEVLVVPIPFFDKNADGSLGQMHYHGEDYPPEVQVVDWKVYQLEERRPDVVFIHNPYDEMNRVTSIHPDYYINNLKKYAGSVVYVPYFVAPNDVLPEHFCLTPVTVNADKIIVQSEVVQKTYIDTLLQFAKENKIKWNRKYLEKKVLPLGSPKYDSKSLNIEIPEEWKSVINRPDGSSKRVLFYNTTLQSVLNQGEKSLDKIQDSLDLFQNKKEDIALLWRPHPLMESTLKSMRPQLLLRYLMIVDKYKKERWGIFDDSQDFSRAVRVSDGCFGDLSSVTEVFRKAKKPVMVGNIDILNQSKKEKVW